jgi:aryl-alcohol dehydrogenase-like predicted oxidoreductase
MGKALSNEDAIAVLQQAYDAGYRHFDTSEIYSSTFPQPHSADTIHNESQIGAWLASPGAPPREAISIATKCMPTMMWGNKTDEETVAAMVSGSLERLGTDYIDLYYLHRLPAQGPEEWTRSMIPQIASGKVRSLGISEASAENIRKAHAICPLSACQYEWSLLTRNVESEIVPTCAELGITLVAYSPLARNLLAVPESDGVENTFRATLPRFTGEALEANQKLVRDTVAAIAASKGVTASQLSLAWLYQRAQDLNVVVLPIPGTTKASHARDNFAGAGVTLTGEDMEFLETLAAQVVGARGSEFYLSHTFEAQSSGHGH